MDFVGSVLKDEKSNVRLGAFRFANMLNTISSNLNLGLFDKLFPFSTTSYPANDNVFEADWLTGASFMVKKNSFMQLNGFDQVYFLYFEEVDLFLRAKRMGYKALYVPKSIVYHESGASTGITNKHNNRQSRRPKYWYESRRRFYVKNYGVLYLAVVDVLMIVSYSLMVIKTKITNCTNLFPQKYITDIMRTSVFYKTRKASDVKRLKELEGERR